MDKVEIISRLKVRGEKARGHLHSHAHVLADELCQKLGDPKHFGAYLKLALSHDHQRLRHILGLVLEDKNAKSKAKLFMYLMKKNL